MHCNIHININIKPVVLTDPPANWLRQLCDDGVNTCRGLSHLHHQRWTTLADYSLGLLHCGLDPWHKCSCRIEAGQTWRRLASVLVGRHNPFDASTILHGWVSRCQRCLVSVIPDTLTLCPSTVLLATTPFNSLEETATARLPASAILSQHSTIKAIISHKLWISLCIMEIWMEMDMFHYARAAYSLRARRVEIWWVGRELLSNGCHSWPLNKSFTDSQ